MLCRITLGGRAGAIMERAGAIIVRGRAIIDGGRAIIEKCTRGEKKVNIYLHVSLLISTFVLIHNYT